MCVVAFLVLEPKTHLTHGKVIRVNSVFHVLTLFLFFVCKGFENTFLNRNSFFRLS